MAPPNRGGRKNPFLNTLSPASKSLGPFQVLDNTRPIKVVTFPYRDVKGGNLIVSVVNQRLGDPKLIIANGRTALTAEVEILGLIQGTPSVLKRAVTRFLTGPITYQFTTWDLYDNITIRARNMTGGFPGPTTVTNTALGYQLQLSVSIQPNLVQEGQYGYGGK